MFNHTTNYSSVIFNKIKDFYTDIISKQTDEKIEQDFRIYGNKILAKYSNIESALRIAGIVTQLFEIKDEILANKLLDIIISYSNEYSVGELNHIVLKFVSAVEKKIINHDNLHFVMSLDRYFLYKFSLDIENNLRKIIQGTINEINTELFASFRVVNRNTEMPIEAIESMTQKIITHLKISNIYSLIPSIEKIFKIDINLWSIVIDVAVHMDLTFINIIEKTIDDLIYLARNKILTEQHRSIFKFILHLDDIRYLYPKQDKPSLDDMAAFFKTYPQLLIFEEIKFPVKNKLTQLSAYHFLINMQDHDFQKKLVALIARVQRLRPKFASVLEAAINQGMLTKTNIDGLDQVTGEQLEDFFNNNLHVNIAMLNDFNISQATDLAQFKQKHPEIGDVELILLALDDPKLTSEKLNKIVKFFIAANNKTAMNNITQHQLNMILIEHLFGSLAETDDLMLQVRQARIILDLYFLLPRAGKDKYPAILYKCVYIVIYEKPLKGLSLEHNYKDFFLPALLPNLMQKIDSDLTLLKYIKSVFNEVKLNKNGFIDNWQQSIIDAILIKADKNHIEFLFRLAGLSLEDMITSHVNKKNWPISIKLIEYSALLFDPKKARPWLVVAIYSKEEEGLSFCQELMKKTILNKDEIMTLLTFAVENMIIPACNLLAKKIDNNDGAALLLSIVRSHNWKIANSLILFILILNKDDLLECYLYAIACKENDFITEIQKYSLAHMKIDIVEVCKNRYFDNKFNKEGWLEIIKVGLPDYVRYLNRQLSDLRLSFNVNRYEHAIQIANKLKSLLNGEQAEFDWLDVLELKHGLLASIYQKLISIDPNFSVQAVITQQNSFKV